MNINSPHMDKVILHGNDINIEPSFNPSKSLTLLAYYLVA